MTEVMVIQEGEEPKNARNFVLVEQIPAPRGSPRYRVVVQRVNDDRPIGVQRTVDSLALAREWAEDIAQKWHSCPPIYMRHPLGVRGGLTGRA